MLKYVILIESIRVYAIITTNIYIFFRFAIKSTILGSAVYYTVDKGVWKDSATTAALYEDLENGVSPYVGELKSQIPYEVAMFSSTYKYIKLFVL